MRASKIDNLKNAFGFFRTKKNNTMPTEIRMQQEKNYPLNCWWIAARSEEITREPIQRWLLDTPVALFRKEDGTPVALDDRCPHRWAPLSDGYMEGDNIVCPYHGARFSSDGGCASFPMQTAIPSTMRVRAFELAERGPFIWIWMGDDKVRAETPLPPDFSWSKDPIWTITSGNYDFEANYMFLHENVLDLTHFNYVHAKSFQFQNWKPAPDFKTEGNRVQSITTLRADDFSEHERVVTGLGAPDASHLVTESWFETPAWHSNVSHVFAKSDPQKVLSSTKISHLLTPASPTSTHYWWYVGSDTPMSSDEAKQFGDMIYNAFLEDKVMIESIQRIIDRDPRGRSYPELSFKNDGSGILARRALDRILAKEAAARASNDAAMDKPAPAALEA
jgi:phenylpropionate dioxygenase-like ring-hydroxylating dioxygenase large terminal subunit